MSGGGTESIQIARLEVRADNAEKDIAELRKAGADLEDEMREADGKLLSEMRSADKARQDDINALRRFNAWLMGAAVAVGWFLNNGLKQLATLLGALK